jgi:hypothetical protein
MNNWEKSVYLSAAAINSEGEALEKQKIHMDSYEASVNRLSDSWDKFLNTAKADTFKGFNNFLGGLLGLVDSLNFSVGDLLKTLGGFIVMTKGEKIFNGTKNFLKSFLSSTKRAITMGEVTKDLPIQDKSVREAVDKVAKLGQSFTKVENVAESLQGTVGKLNVEGEKINRSTKKRIKIYNNLELTTEQAKEAEEELANARKKALEATAKPTITGSFMRVAGQAMLYAQMASAIVSGIFSAIDALTEDASDKARKGLSQAQSLREKIEKSSAQETKSNLDMLTKVATQVNAGEISPELQSELTTIIETLNENLGVNKSLLKTDANGNETLKNLEELVAEYETEIASQSFESFMGGRETLFSDLNKQLADKNYKAFGVGANVEEIVGDAVSVAAGAAGGALQGAALGAVGGPIGAGIGALIGGAVGLISSIFDGGSYKTVGGVGEDVTLEEAIRITEENYKNALKNENAEIISQLKDSLDQLKEIKTTIDEQTEALREDYSANLQMLANSLGKTKIAPTDVAMIQSIIDVVASELSLEQMASKEVYDTFRQGIKELVVDLTGVDTKAAYTEIYKTFESGGYFASLLGDNTSALRQVGAIISANGPTLASAASALREELEKNSKEYERQLSATEHRSKMLNSLATLGADSNFSKDQILSMLNIGGAVNTSGIVDPALRSYAQGLVDLYEEYWGEDGKIANASYLQDQEKLGEEYARAVSLKEKEYEILKKQLEVQKSQNKLAEAQRERDTLVFRNGRFMYEANPNTIKQLTEEQEKLKAELDQLTIQQAINENIVAEQDELEGILTATNKIVELLEGDVAANVLKIQESIGEDIQKDIADGIIDNPMYYMLYQMISGLSADYQDKLSQLELFTDKEGNFITGLTGKSPYDKGGLLQGKGLFSKQTSLDEVVLSATDAPKILSLLSKTGEFQDTVLQANTLLKSLGIKDGKISSLLTQTNGGNIIFWGKHLGKKIAVLTITDSNPQKLVQILFFP